ncbi:MAG: 50S ribosomal protein L18 [Holosporales bacterium]
MLTSKDKHQRRTQRVRTKIAQTASGRPRLSVFRSNKHIHVQIIDDAKRCTLVAASTVEKDLREKLKNNGGNKAAAELVGKLVAERAQKAGIKQVVFDRGGYLFHGRVRALAEAARSGGLDF